MGMRHGGAWLDRGDGIDWWGCTMGARDTGWIREMGLIHEAHDIAWIGAMGLIHGGTPWGLGTLAGSGRWDWFIGARHGGARPWLDRGDGFDWWVLVTLAGPGWWDWFMWARSGGAWHWLDRGNGIDSWGCANGKVIWLLNLNDDTMCPHVWRWGKCAECVWLRGWQM